MMCVSGRINEIAPPRGHFQELRLWTSFALIAPTGCRRGEMIALK